MSGFDRFEQIALQREAFRKDMLEWEPLKLDKSYYPIAGNMNSDELPDDEEKTYAEEMIDFHAGLNDLRKKYARYLLDLSPERKITRQKYPISEMDFRFAAETVRKRQSKWERIRLPDYRGPAGKWKAWYKTHFDIGIPGDTNRVYICFKGVDYKCKIYINGLMAGSHEGFFAAFSFDITDYLKKNGSNLLKVEIENDIPTIGNDSNQNENGDKIYAATGLGWDDSQTGWHHCPPGAGIFDDVWIEERPVIHILSVSAVPDTDSGSIRCTIIVNNDSGRLQGINLDLSAYPLNFKGRPLFEGFNLVNPEICSYGINYYYTVIPMPEYRIWTQDEPWLYSLRVDLSGPVSDSSDIAFGMRKFHMDESGDPKGTLFLNDRVIFLRGANDMGHMQQCVLKKDFNQLIDDILIAKYAGMNFYRFTQRPVQQEIYDYCDRLGMLNQTDFPLFGYLRRNQFIEALRQVGEMEDHIINHPSAIMVTYMNEAINTADGKLNNRHLNRDELENFFICADTVIAMKNPSRVIKHVEGDYQPPTLWGLSDFHCYNLWYTNHAISIGKLYKGWLPRTQKGWKTGCGEYGTEGLDNREVMYGRYPKEWLPENPGDCWNPGTIVLAQSNSMHGDWYEEQETLEDWIRESQKHQAFAAKTHTECLRRRSDLVVSTAIHLLIDAWPSGWMKSIVGVDRIPKPAYFAFRRSLKPLRLSIRCDRRNAYAGESVDMEIWCLNDTDEAHNGWSVHTSFHDSSGPVQINMKDLDIGASGSFYTGSVKADIPDIQGNEIKSLRFAAYLLDKSGVVRDIDTYEIKAFARPRRMIKAAAIGAEAKRVLDLLNIGTMDCGEGPFLISSFEEFMKHSDTVICMIKKGTTAVFLLPEEKMTVWEIDGISFKMKKCNGLSFLARNPDNKYSSDFAADDFSYPYNSNEDRIDFAATSYFELQNDIDLFPGNILYTYSKPGFHDSVRNKKKKLSVVLEYPLGNGKIVLCSVLTEGRTGYNPTFDRLLLNLFDNPPDLY